MIETKLFEVRDVGTFIPCIGIKMQSVFPSVFGDQSHNYDSNAIAEDYLLRRSGYNFNDGLILFGKLIGGNFSYDHISFCDSKTLQAAHMYIEQNWDDLESGQVIDIEYITGKTPAAKISERFL